MPRIAPYGRQSHHPYVVNRKECDQLLSRALALYEVGETARAHESVIKLKDALSALHQKIVNEIIQKRQKARYG